MQTMTTQRAPSDRYPIAVAGLFPDYVHTVIASPEAAVGPLLAEEEHCVRRAVPKRRAEFASGRACARAALARLGIHGYLLAIGPDGAPVWPKSVTGSITHCAGFVGAAVAPRSMFRSIGFDAEGCAPLDPKLAVRVCGPSELEWMTEIPAPISTDWPKVLFSVKEAVYKCVSPLTGKFLSFHDVAVTVTPGTQTFRAHLPWKIARLLNSPSLEGRFLVSGRHVFAGVALRAEHGDTL